MLSSDSLSLQTFPTELSIEPTSGLCCFFIFFEGSLYFQRRKNIPCAHKHDRYYTHPLLSKNHNAFVVPPVEPIRVSSLFAIRFASECKLGNKTWQF